MMLHRNLCAALCVTLAAAKLAPPTHSAVKLAPRKAVKLHPVAKLSGGAATTKTAELLFGAGGIYVAFLYYGSLQEDVFRYAAEDGSKFTQVWFLQVLEALCNVVVGFVGLQVTGGATPDLPQKLFASSGCSQVLAKYCTNAALANGLSFPVATLAKSGKMVPVMVGSLLLGGASYSLKQYLQVAMIVGGTAIVSLSKKKASAAATASLGVAFIVASLCFDGITGGLQKKVKSETKARGASPKPYDFMFLTNVYMLATALVFALARGEVQQGLAFALDNPALWGKLLRFGACSAVGQSFIFYTISTFDPLVCTTVTTTRKIFSVLLSIFLKGHELPLAGWGGIALASAGILMPLVSK